jgi:ATP-dependent Lon protease
MEVAIELDMDSTEVNKTNIDYLRLSKLDRFDELLSPANTEKMDLILMLANIFHIKGISEKQEISHILKQIKDLETLQQQINIATDLKSNLIYETTQLQDEENNLKKILKVILAGITICSFQRRIKTEIYEKEKRLEQLNKLVQDIYNLEAFQKLEQNLIDNIENAIL